MSNCTSRPPKAASDQPDSCLLSFLIPTRNNLPGLTKLFDSIVATTAVLAELEIVLAMDEDDTESQALDEDRLRIRKVVVPKGLTMGALNNACFEASTGRYLMLMNDDVVLRTKHWDRQVLDVYRSFPDDIALIHVNDLLFRERLCTFPMLSRRACQAIGLCPVAYRRYRIDDHIYDIYNLLAHLGHRRIVYLPDVVFEHENHEAEAPSAQGHRFASADKKVYVPKAGIIEADAKYCDDHFADRKAAALHLAELIENDSHRRALDALQQQGASRLAAVADSHGYRRPAYLRVQPTGMVRDTSNARTTVAVVTADLQGEVAQRCLKAIKTHTRNYDLIVLDNNRGPNFNHPREMNRVLQTCGTEFLVLLDDDVFVEAGWLDGLLRCVDESTGVVVPLHKDRAGALSFSGIYFLADGRGSHAHTLDRPKAPRVIQSYCSAAMLIDMRKCGHIRMDETYHKYFFDLVHGFEVWEAGWRAVCCPDVTVTHLGGATMTWGSAEANAFLERDRDIFVRSWIETGRLSKLRSGPWKNHPCLVQLNQMEELPGRIKKFLTQSLRMPKAQFETQLTDLAKLCAPFKLLMHQLVSGLSEQIVTFAEKGELERVLLSCRLAAEGENPATEVQWLLAALRPLFQAKRFESAEKLLSSGLERHATEFSLWRALGIVRITAGQAAGALEAFERAVNLAAGDVDSQIGLGMVLVQLKRPVDAANRLAEAIQLCRKADPNDPRLPMLTKHMETAASLAPAKAAAVGLSPTGRRFAHDSARSVAATQPAKASLASEEVDKLPRSIRASTTEQEISPSKPSLRILLIPFECANWQNARAWSYNGYFAFEEGLKAAGVDFFTLPAIAGFPSDHPASWLKYARDLIRGQHFDQVWIWLSHNEYQPDLFALLGEIAPVRVGVIMESMEHTPEELKAYAQLPGRRERVTTMLRHLTHVLAFDEQDAEGLAEDLPLCALWCPPVVSSGSICAAVDLPVCGPAIFNGTLYSPERRSFLEHPKLRNKLVQPPLPEDQTDWPARFDALQLRSFNLLGGGQQPTATQLHAYLDELRTARREMYALWLQALRTGYATVNLPSIYKGYAGRVVESMAAGRPVVSWAPPRMRTRALFVPDREILLFDRKNPEQLRRQINRLQEDRAFALALAERARAKVQRHHTAEARVRQILDWIEYDTQPDYAEATGLGQNPVSARQKSDPQAASSLGRASVTGAEKLAAATLDADQVPNNAGAWTRLARTALQSGAVERFEAALVRAMELDPNGRDALKLLGDLCVRDGQTSNAIQNYYRILQTHPDDVPVLYSLGFTLEQAGEWDSAFSLYDHLMRVFPHDTVLAQRVARLRKNFGQPKAASDVPGNATRLASSPCPTSPVEPVRSLPGQGAPPNLPFCASVGQIDPARIFLASKSYSAAWSATLAAIRMRPYHPEAYLLLAQIALAAGDGASARRFAQVARVLAPKWKEAKKFLRGNLRGNAKPDWLVLPEGFPGDATGHFDASTRLSICLIVKNEEKFLGRCLDSVKAFAHQLIVVDTGSTDSTLQIAKSHGAEIYHFDWCDDFSAARNAALEHATGDWILMIDADEELDASGRVHLRNQLLNSAVMGWRLPLINVGREAEGASYIPRLFRNAPGLFYVGRIHEQVFSGVERLCSRWGLENRLGESTLVHHGYTTEMTLDRKKVERNLRLLEAAIEEQPLDPHLLMQLGLELNRSGRASAALVRYREAFNLLSTFSVVEVSPELRETLLAQYSTRLVASKEFSEVVRILDSPLARSQNGLTASLRYTLGLAKMELGEFQSAADQFQLCLKQRGQRHLCPVHVDIDSAAPFHCLAMCQMELGNVMAAESAFEEGIKSAKESDELRVEFARFLFKHNRPVDALNRLHDTIRSDPHDLAAWRLGGEIALSQPQFLEVAVNWTNEAVQHEPRDRALLAQQAEALLLSQKTAEALLLWRRLWSEDPQPSNLAATIFCELVLGEVPRVATLAEMVATARAFLDWYRRSVAAGARESIVGINGRLDDLRHSLPAAAQTLENVLAEADHVDIEETCAPRPS